MGLNMLVTWHLNRQVSPDTCLAFQTDQVGSVLQHSYLYRLEAFIEKKRSNNSNKVETLSCLVWGRNYFWYVNKKKSHFIKPLYNIMNFSPKGLWTQLMHRTKHVPFNKKISCNLNSVNTYHIHSVRGWTHPNTPSLSVCHSRGYPVTCQPNNSSKTERVKKNHGLADY